MPVCFDCSLAELCWMLCWFVVCLLLDLQSMDFCLFIWFAAICGLICWNFDVAFVCLWFFKVYAGCLITLILGFAYW